MTTPEAILAQYGVIASGHFCLTSGLHSAQYFQKFRILEHPPLVMEFARLIAERFQDQGVTIVCGPTTGGVIIAYEVARQLRSRCVVAERAEPQGRRIGRGFQIGSEDRILVVDDVLTTGGSIRDTLAALQPFPCTVLGIGVFIDRSPGQLFDLPCFAVYRQPVENYAPDNCPLCRQGLPLTTGH
ncbi:MAG: phosphoribosyltransferase family protein [candidate division WOR-3 bacterium]